MTNYKHETAIIDSGAQIGEGSAIWHFSHICGDVIIGKDCSLGQNVYVANKVRIGNGVKIQNNVSIYEGVSLEDLVFCGPSTVFTNVFNPRSEFPRKHELVKTHIKRGASLGANCTIVCGITVGAYAFVGAGAVVTEDIKDFALVVGVPGKQIGWMSRFGNRISLPLQGDGEEVCGVTGDIYRLVDDHLEMRTGERG